MTLRIGWGKDSCENGPLPVTVETLAFFEVFSVRKNIVDSWSCFVFELETGIYNDDVVFILDNRHVPADFLDAATKILNNAGLPAKQLHTEVF